MTIYQEEIKVTLEELGSKHSNYIPSDTQLLQLMKPNVNIMSFNEWNDIFSTNYGLVLESGKYPFLQSCSILFNKQNNTI